MRNVPEARAFAPPSGALSKGAGLLLVVLACERETTNGDATSTAATPANEGQSSTTATPSPTTASLAPATTTLPEAPACPEQGTVGPFNDYCEEEVCQLAIRLDGATLGLRGWLGAGGAHVPLDAKEAEAVAANVFRDAREEFASLRVRGPFAGVFLAEDEDQNSGGFVLIGATTTLPVTAAGIPATGRGEYWKPRNWGDASIISCGDERHEPNETKELGSCGAGSTLHTTRDALDLALRTNFGAHFDALGDFSAFSYLHTPARDACATRSTDLIVVLTRVASVR